MLKLSNAAQEIKPSLTRKLFNMAKEYNDVIDFTLGDPDVPTPLPIKEAGCEAIMKGKTRYSQNAGLLELRESISRHYQEKEDLFYNPTNEIIVTVGAMEGLYLSLLTILDNDDEVIIPAPYYVNYEQMVRLCHGRPVIVENSHNCEELICTAEDIEAAITDKTKAIILNTPCNPTGKVLPSSLLEHISKIAKNNDLFIITDEVYKCLIYDKRLKFPSIATLPEMKERTILVNSLSKEFCMTGWRVGYVLAPEFIISTMTKFQENIVACAPLPSQYAAIKAFSPNTDYSADMVSIFKRRRDVLQQEVAQIPKLKCHTPEATFYAMIDISDTGMKSEAFAYSLLQSVHVAVVPGITYGKMCDNYVRIAFTLEEEKIKEGIRRLKQFIETL